MSFNIDNYDELTVVKVNKAFLVEGLSHRPYSKRNIRFSFIVSCCSCFDVRTVSPYGDTPSLSRAKLNFVHGGSWEQS